MYFQCQRFCQGMIILNRHSQHILPDNWSKPLSIYPPQSPSLVVSKKEKETCNFKCIDGWHWSANAAPNLDVAIASMGMSRSPKHDTHDDEVPEKKLIHIVFKNEPNQSTILIYFCSLKGGVPFAATCSAWYHITTLQCGGIIGSSHDASDYDDDDKKEEVGENGGNDEGDSWTI